MCSVVIDDDGIEAGRAAVAIHERGQQTTYTQASWLASFHSRQLGGVGESEAGRRRKEEERMGAWAEEERLRLGLEVWRRMDGKEVEVAGIAVDRGAERSSSSSSTDGRRRAAEGAARQQ